MNEKSNNLENNSVIDAYHCDGCKYLMFTPDPDPTDWFRDDDKKAICTAEGKTIARSLEFNELTRIIRPKFCPRNKLHPQNEYIQAEIKHFMNAFVEDPQYDVGFLNVYKSNLLTLTMCKDGKSIIRCSRDLNYLSKDAPKWIAAFVEGFITAVKAKYGNDSIQKVLPDDPDTYIACSSCYQITK